MFGFFTNKKKTRPTRKECREYNNLPWHIPKQYWENSELKILSKHKFKEGMRKLDAAVETAKRRKKADK